LNKEVQQKYEEAGFDYFENATDLNEKAFFEKTKLSKKPITHKLVKIVRIRNKDGEHVYYHETLISKDFLNNRIDHSRVMGRYEDPDFVSTVDPRTNLPRATEISSTSLVYQYSWTPNIVDQWLSQEGFELDDNATYMVIDGGRKYGGFTYEQFCNETFDNLVTIGRFGTLEPKGIEKVMRKRNKQIETNQ
jgi:hypothetical protein